MKTLVVLGVLSLLYIHAAWPQGQNYSVTPDNVDELKLHFEVEVRDGPLPFDGALSFYVFVSSGREELSPERSGALTIMQDKNPLILGTFAIEGRSTSGVVRYTFFLHEDLIMESQFVFTQGQVGSLANEAYRIRLRDFVEVAEE